MQKVVFALNLICLVYGEFFRKKKDTRMRDTCKWRSGKDSDSSRLKVARVKVPCFGSLPLQIPQMRVSTCVYVITLFCVLQQLFMSLLLNIKIKQKVCAEGTCEFM